MPATDPPVRLKGNYYGRPDHFRTDVAKGVTRTPTGQRVCGLPGDFLLGFRDAVLYECGKAYRPVLKAAGRRWGQSFAKRLDKELTAFYGTAFKSLPPGLVHTCLADAFAAYGFGRLAVLPGDEFTVVEVADPVMPSLVREAERPVDLVMAGLVGAVFSHLTGHELDAVQTDCPAVGADKSRFVVGPAARIVEVEAWATAADKWPTHDAVLRKLRKPAAQPHEGAVA